jgi:hypothetical protein
MPNLLSTLTSRITNRVDEQHMGYLQLDRFFNLDSHMDSHGNALRTDTPKQAADSRAQS